MNHATSSVRHLIVGGGPAAAAAAAALAQHGEEATVVDTGLRLETDRARSRSQLASLAPQNWPAEALEVFSYDKERAFGLGQKRLFGSDFAYANPDLVTVDSDEVGARPSFAAGGLSNVWGAGLLPYSEEDLHRWPIGSAELAPHYAAIVAMLPLSAECDDLAPIYPLYGEPDGLLVRSVEGERTLARLRDSNHLHRRGWRFGAARLAVRTGRPAPQQGCVYCGRCLEGCPYGHIYNAADTLDELARAGAIEYRSGQRVERLHEEADRVVLEMIAVGSGERSTLIAQRVFLGAGALSSTFILQRSGVLGPEVELLDSQTLYLPLLAAGLPAPKGEQDAYVLAQAFALLREPAVSARSVHLSLYGYSRELPERVRDLRPRLARLLGPLLERATRQLMFAICFLHSDDSSRFISHMAENGFRLEPRTRPETSATVRRLQHRLLVDLVVAGLLPISLASEIAKPGGGYHYGGSAPMCADPTPGTADLLGRPFSSQRVHLIDAACFPSIPGGPITFSIMANAHRIATAALSR